MCIPDAAALGWNHVVDRNGACTLSLCHCCSIGLYLCMCVCVCVGHCVSTLMCDASMCNPGAVALGWDRVSSLYVICTLSGPMAQHWFLFAISYWTCAVSCVM